jgi:hypothetical protein
VSIVGDLVTDDFELPVSLEFRHHAADQILRVHNGFRNDLNVHRRFSRLACTLAVNAVLADQHQRVGENVQRDGQAASRNTHHKFVLFEFLAPFFKYVHYFSLAGWLRQFDPHTRFRERFPNLP